MHVPDGYLDIVIAATFWLAALVSIGIATRRARGSLGDERTPLLGVVAAGIFAAQMLNWPIPGGTSAHFVGGAFAGILLGPSLGILAMTAVVGIQALVFGDGGIIALGANLFPMAVVDVVVGYAVFQALRTFHETGAAFVAGWVAITVSAVVLGAGLGLSSTFAYDLTTTLLVMGGGHFILGVIEGAITASVYAYVVNMRPDLILTRGDGVIGTEVGA
jgi:cobalt/nickel transport system permease protein